MINNKYLLSITWLFFFISTVFAGASLNESAITTEKGDLTIHSVDHATFVMRWNNLTIIVDPVGGEKSFAGLKKANIILITDIHYDHLNVETIAALTDENTKIILPEAAEASFPDNLKKHLTILNNDEDVTFLGINFKAVPMYNTTKDRLKFHPKGRGNGYIARFSDKAIYISGDTEFIQEMKQLGKIDAAVLCMNLPYTMDVSQAVEAVQAIKPKVVFPYHYRGANNVKTDLKLFEKLVKEKDSSIEIRILKWYQD